MTCIKERSTNTNIRNGLPWCILVAQLLKIQLYGIEIQANAILLHLYCCIYLYSLSYPFGIFPPPQKRIWYLSRIDNSFSL